MLLSALLFVVSLASASSTCPPSSDSKCGDKPDVRVTNASLDPENALFRFAIGGEQLTPVNPALLTRKHTKCASELEQIIYTPPNAARDYLLQITRKIAADISAGGGGVGDTQTNALIKSLSARYNADIEFQPAFYNRPNIIFRPNANPVPFAGFRRYGHLIAPTYLNQAGFQYNSKQQTYSLALFTKNLNTAIGTTIIVTIDANAGVFFEC